MSYQDWLNELKAAVSAQQQANDSLDVANGQLAALLANPPVVPTPLVVTVSKDNPDLLIHISEV